MSVNEFAGILTVIVIAATITLALVQDAASHKAMDFPKSALDKITDGSTWIASPEPTDRRQLQHED
jgi:hypothetical protein